MNAETQPTTPTPGQQPLMGGSEGESFWSKNGKMITRLVIVAIIIAGAVIYARNQSQPEQPAINQSIIGGQSDSGTGPKIKVSENQEPGTAAGQDIVISGGEVTVTAQKGNGYTHLARRALAEYLKTNNTSQLLPEQKIFIEDYLQKKIPGKSSLHTGEQVNFSESDIQGAVSAAQNLTERQLQNLHQYTLRVSNL